MTDDISDGMLELMLYKFKKWLGSVPRELQRRNVSPSINGAGEGFVAGFEEGINRYKEENNDTYRN